MFRIGSRSSRHENKLDVLAATDCEVIYTFGNALVWNCSARNDQNITRHLPLQSPKRPRPPRRRIPPKRHLLPKRRRPPKRCQTPERRLPPKRCIFTRRTATTNLKVRSSKRALLTLEASEKLTESYLGVFLVTPKVPDIFWTLQFEYAKSHYTSISTLLNIVALQIFQSSAGFTIENVPKPRSIKALLPLQLIFRVL